MQAPQLVSSLADIWTSTFYQLPSPAHVFSCFSKSVPISSLLPSLWNWGLCHLFSRLLQLITEMPFPLSVAPAHLFKCISSNSTHLHPPLVPRVFSSRNLVCGFKFAWFATFSNISTWQTPAQSSRPSSHVFSSKAPQPFQARLTSPFFMVYKCLCI